MSKSDSENSDIEDEKEEEIEVVEEVEEDDEEELGEDDGEDCIDDGDGEIIKVNTSSKIEVGDLGKIKRNFLKKKFTNLKPISRSIKKIYRNITVPLKTEYKYLQYDLEDYITDVFPTFKDWISTNKIEEIDAIYNLSFVNQENNIKGDDLYECDVFTEEKNKNQQTAKYLIEEPDLIECDSECKKCKCKKILTFKLQTRSCDEPMTTFFTCIKCGNKWKE